MEEWRDVPGFEGFYQVSNLGRVKSLPRRCSVHGITRRSVTHDETWLRSSKILKYIYSNNSAVIVHLHDKDNKRHDYPVKVLVAMVFLTNGQKPRTQDVKLIDGDRMNCHLDNIQLVKVDDGT